MELEEIEKRFRQHFPSSEVRRDNGSIEFNSSTSSFRIGEDGTVEAEMPLHSFSASGFDRLKFEEGEVKIFTEQTEYTFRK